jgi:hypothetical protein
MRKKNLRKIGKEIRKEFNSIGDNPGGKDAAEALITKDGEFYGPYIFQAHD